MDEYADIYYVDSRNATRDHRPAGSRPMAWGQAQPMAPTRAVFVPPTAQPAFAQTTPVYAQPPVYQQPQIWYPGTGQSTMATLFGKLTTGQIVDMIAQVWAALQTLPGAPSPTDDTTTDLSNLVTYQSALASHAKRDEQVRTLGSIVARLVG